MTIKSAKLFVQNFLQVIFDEKHNRILNFEF
jgi:hypothetical protein